MRCSSCKTDNPSDATFCEQCGSKLELVCPACRAAVSPGVRFCKKCGAAIRSAKAAADAAGSIVDSQIKFADVTGADSLEGERSEIGDYGVKICRLVADSETDIELGTSDRVLVMAQIAQSMVADSLEALAGENSELARAVIRRDDEVDSLCRQVSEETLATMTADPSLVRQGARRLFVSKDLERIADHATGIARTVIFVVDGKKCAARESELRVGEKGRARFRTSFGLLVSVEVNGN